MTRFAIPIILLGIAGAVFFTFTNKTYNEITALKENINSYNTALGNSKVLENERDKLTAKYNSFSKDDLSRLEKLLPENVDNIRLVLEIEQLAQPYGMTLKDVKYNTTEMGSAATSNLQVGAVGKADNKDYGTFDLEFSTSGSYRNFVNFTKDLEKNLRIVDVSSITFLPSVSNTKNPFSSEIYKYGFKIKTYWLKN